jgi:hypothetical protein
MSDKTYYLFAYSHRNRPRKETVRIFEDEESLNKYAIKYVHRVWGEEYDFDAHWNSTPIRSYNSIIAWKISNKTGYKNIIKFADKIWDIVLKELKKN